MTTMMAPISVTGITGTSQINRVRTAMPMIISFIFKSWLVRLPPSLLAPVRPFMASRKVR